MNSKKQGSIFGFVTFIFMIEIGLIIAKFLNALAWSWHWVLAPLWIIGLLSSIGSFVIWLTDKQ